MTIGGFEPATIAPVYLGMSDLPSGCGSDGTLIGMADEHPHARELGDFLRARRNRLRPEDVGLEPGGRRRVPGLRREELALLAGLSTDYYQRMEQGRDVRPSDDILDAIASALVLDEEERRHLFTCR